MTVRPREEMERLGFDVIYIKPKDIEKYNACYRVEYRGQEIYPPVADELGIPMNEIWISERLKEFEKYILHHELQEIKHRARGLDVKTAHEKALEDEKVFKGNPKWEKLKREINLAPEEVLTGIKGVGKKIFETIMKNRPYHEMEELRDVPLVGLNIYERLKGETWSMYQNPAYK
ncbi:MAG: hypothetical protein V5A79_01195 [Candidatus Bipolaricaulota bacterium]|nr:hypothetical protein [Candidatus Bipolaricaulota bacterium]